MKGMPYVGEDVIVFEGERALGWAPISSFKIGEVDGREGVWVHLDCGLRFAPFFVERSSDWETSIATYAQDKRIAPMLKCPNAVKVMNRRWFRETLGKLYDRALETSATAFAESFGGSLFGGEKDETNSNDRR